MSSEEFENANVVSLGKRRLTLRAPASPFLATEALLLQHRSELAGAAMALAICWPDDAPGRPRASLAGMGHASGRFAEAVYNELLQKHTAAEIFAAGQSALRLLARVTPTGPAVQAAEDFSRATAADSP